MANPAGAPSDIIPGLGLNISRKDTANSEVSIPDVHMAETDDESTGSLYEPAPPLINDNGHADGSMDNKRTAADLVSPGERGGAKRARLDVTREEESLPRDRAQQLPAEIWHHIFTLLDPRALGVLLSVNKLFNTYLDPAAKGKVSHSVPLSPFLQFLKPEAIWQASRRNFWPKMPSPLKTRSELDMWRIACSRSCQFCKTRDPSKGGVADDQWHSGPGAKGVSPIFPFFLACCGQCLSEKSLKELDILLSSSIPSVLLPGLPVVFMTADLHVISPSTISSGIPPTGQITKVYWPEQMENIKGELEAVKELGAAAAEEWFKGLEIRGKHALADASRWEKWYQSGGVHRMREPILPTPSVPVEVESISVFAPSTHHPSLHDQDVTGARQAAETEPAPAPAELNGLTAEVPETSVNAKPRSSGQQKLSTEEISQLRAKRRTEIERRALLLDPPLPANVLSHMSSFQAALQIFRPLDDNAWELLKPRLLAQRETAEQRAKEIATDAQALQAGSKSTTSKVENEGDAAQPKQVTDEDWNEIQGPVRARISAYADEIIRDGWNEGEKVTKKTSPQFAVESLLYVRKRFYAEVAKDAAAAIAAGKSPVTDPPEGPWTQKLTLENMKWVFDMKIKQYTDRFRKEVFLCNGCEGNYKFYGFESVIQHYAAKHTTALSVGTMVVHWRAEWPETPIFHYDPKQAGPPKVAKGKGKGKALQPPLNTTQAPYTGHGYGPQPLGVYPPPDAYYGYSAQTPYLDPMAYAPAMVPNGSHGGGYAPPQVFAPDGNGLPYLHGLQPSSNNLYYGEQAHAYDANGHDYGYGQKPFQDNGPAIKSQQYRSQLQRMAGIARATWQKLKNIKGLPAVVQTCVTIHHVAKTFQEEFSEAAPLAMFIDGLSNVKEMRPVRKVNQLACKACVASRGEGPVGTTYSLPQLVNHFNAVHFEGAQRQNQAPLDWRVDMILLPDMSVLSSLPKILENNKTAFDVVYDAMPWAFERGPPGLEVLPQPRPATTTGEPPLQETAMDEDDDPYSPPDAAEPAIAQHGQDGWPKRENPPQPHNVSQLRSEPGTSHRRNEAPATQGGSHAQALESVPYNSERPNLKPANAVYDRKESQRIHRSKPSKRDRLEERPAVPVEQHEPSHRPVRDDGGVSEPSMNLPRSSLKHEVDVNYESSRPVEYAPRDAYLRDVRPRDQHQPLQRLEEDPYQPSRVTATRPPTRALVSRQPDIDYRPSSTFETPREEMGYRPAQGFEPHRVARQGTAAPEYPRAVRYVDEPIYAPEPRRRSISPRYAPHDPYARGPYRERSPVVRYAEPRYRDEERYITYRAHPDDLHPRYAPPAAPVEAYELVEVRDPQGSYYIKRPVRREPIDAYAYDIHPGAREVEPLPHSRHPPPMVDPRPVASRPGIYDSPSRPATAMKRQHSKTDLEEYDPRFPAGEAPPSSRQRRY